MAASSDGSGVVPGTMAIGPLPEATIKILAEKAGEKKIVQHRQIGAAVGVLALNVCLSAAFERPSPMLTTNQKVHGIVHTTATGAAGVGAGLAQIPGSDGPVLSVLQTAMILAIAHEHGATITKAAAAELLLTFTASLVGRGISQLLVGWVPGWGNALNATTAAAMTEAVGWAAHAYFSETRKTE